MLAQELHRLQTQAATATMTAEMRSRLDALEAQAASSLAPEQAQLMLDLQAQQQEQARQMREMQEQHQV